MEEMNHSGRPLLLIDIDGVISLYGFPPGGEPPGSFLTVDGILHFISASAGPLLGSLAGAFELVWCSGWEEKANEYLPSRLGLPNILPHVALGSPGTAGAHWKLGAIDAFAGPQRPLAWIDDAHDGACHAWAVSRAAPTLLVHSEPPTGITEQHVHALLEWARSL